MIYLRSDEECEEHVLPSSSRKSSTECSASSSSCTSRVANGSPHGKPHVARNGFGHDVTNETSREGCVGLGFEGGLAAQSRNTCSNKTSRDGKLGRDASDANATASTERHANLIELAELSGSRERHGNLTARKERGGNASARRDANLSAAAAASYRQRKEHVVANQVIKEKEHLVANQVTYFIYCPTTRSYMNIQYDIKVCVCTHKYININTHTHT
jgi:hypothetical protein